MNHPLKKALVVLLVIVVGLVFYSFIAKYTALQLPDFSFQKSETEIIEMMGNRAVKALKNRDSKTLALMMHPQVHLRFSPFPSFSADSISFSQDEVQKLFADNHKYLWGYTDGKGDPILMTPQEYYTSYLYAVDFSNAPQKYFAQPQTSRGNNVNTILQTFPGARVAEFYFPGFNPEYEGMDWKSLLIIFAPSGGKWFLVGIANNQWGI